MKITLKNKKTGKKVTLAKKPKPKYNRPRYA